MKFRNCFIDEQGRIFKDETLIKASNQLEIFQFELTDEMLDEVIRWKLVNFHDYLVHFKRVRDADLNHPIILRSDGVVMDGRHRILKAILDNTTSIRAVKFKTDPEPDFTT